MDQIVLFPVKLDTPAQLEILQERACCLDSGVEVTSTVQVVNDQNYAMEYNFT